MYDVIVVGARVAGSTTALLLARAGLRVLVVDRAKFPSDTLSSHFIHPAGISRLQKWGLLSALEETGCPAVSTMRFDLGDFALYGEFEKVDQTCVGFAPRRLILDQLLIDAAAAEDVEVRTEFSVLDLIVDEGRVVGIRGKGSDGALIEERARWVIGADGARSVVASLVHAEEYEVKPTLTCNYYTYWKGLEISSAELYIRKGRFIVAFPTHDGAALVGVVWPKSEFKRVRGNLEQEYLESVQAFAPHLYPRLRKAERVEKFYGTGDLPFFLRRPFGAGWALVGDAGCHKDPITAQGLTDALRDVELLVNAIRAIAWDGADEGEAFEAYELARNEEVLPMYHFTEELAQLHEPPPHMQRVFRAIRENPKEISRFFGMITGSVHIPDYMDPSNLERITSAAETSHPSASA